MSTSGTVTYKTDRNGIINGALRLIGAVDPENASGATTNQITNAAEALNLMVKEWETEGLQLWERRYGVVFPQTSQAVFVLGSPGPAGDHACLATPLGVGGFVQTTLASSAASGASTIVVTTTSSAYSAGIAAVTMTDTYNIGIELDDGTVQWTTVSGAPSGTTVTLAATLTDDATAGNYVYCYQTKLQRPLRILDAWIRQTGGNDTPLRKISREEYNRFGNKAIYATPTQFYYDVQRATGYLYLYPGFLSARQPLYIEFQKAIEDFSSSTDDYDLPQEWGNALKYNLAVMMAPEYEVPDTKFKKLVFLADRSFERVSGYDQEDSAVFIQPDSHNR